MGGAGWGVGVGVGVVAWVGELGGKSKGQLPGGALAAPAVLCCAAGHQGGEGQHLAPGVPGSFPRCARCAVLCCAAGHQNGEDSIYHLESPTFFHAAPAVPCYAVPQGTRAGRTASTTWSRPSTARG